MLLLGAGKSNFAKIPSLLITVQPASIEVYEGQSASFSVSAIGATSYQWQKSINDGFTWSDIVGATQANYTIDVTVRTTHSDNRLRCIVAGDSGSVTSNAVVLNVWNPLSLGSDLGFWLDPTFGLFTERTGPEATTPVADNGSVGTYRSRNNINAVSYGDTNKPIYRSAGLNGTPCIEFDGVNDAINLVPDFASGLRYKDSAYIFAGMSVDTLPGYEKFFLTFGSLNYSYGLLDFYFGNDSYPERCYLRINHPNSGSGYNVISNTYFTSSQPFVFGAECYFIGSLSKLRKNGSVVATDSGAYTGFSADTDAVWNIIGGIGGGTFDPFKGKIGHMVVATPSTEFSSATISKIEGFINYKSGLIY